MENKVYNKYHNTTPSNAVYIGRGSPYGNPFVIGVHGTRDEVCDRYEAETLPGLDLKDLIGKDLVCFCKPQRCHGDAILAEVKKRYGDKKTPYIRNWFSNMLKMDEPYIYQGVYYRTSEHFYQAMKMPKDRLDLRAELAAMSPFEAKKAIRDEVKFPWRETWNQEESLKVMEHILRFKFTKETSWGKKLLETEGEIVENNNWGDVFWGFDINQNKGDNHLGKILMKIREEIK